jgi:hypothetical protein
MKLFLASLTIVATAACGARPDRPMAVNFSCRADGAFYVASVNAARFDDARWLTIAIAERTCDSVNAHAYTIGSVSVLR